MPDPLGLIPANTSAAAAAGGQRAARGPQQTNGPSFKDVLMANIEQVNRLQQDAQTAIEDLASGKRDDIAAVATAKQKADLAFQALLQVRNKLMDAYQEIQQIRV